MKLVNKKLEGELSQRSFLINNLNTSGFFRDGDIQYICVQKYCYTPSAIYDVPCYFHLNVLPSTFIIHGIKQQFITLHDYTFNY